MTLGSKFLLSYSGNLNQFSRQHEFLNFPFRILISISLDNFTENKVYQSILMVSNDWTLLQYWLQAFRVLLVLLISWGFSSLKLKGNWPDIDGILPLKLSTTITMKNNKQVFWQNQIMNSLCSDEFCLKLYIEILIWHL